MQGQVAKPVWNGSNSRDASARTRNGSIRKDRSKLEASDLPSKYALRWAVIGFCAAFWAGVIAAIVALV